MTRRPFHVVDTDGPVPTLVRDIQDVSRRLRADVPDLSPAESQFLRDVERGEGRYRFRAVQRLFGICRRATDAGLREALAETIRAQTICGPSNVLPFRDVMIAETRAQSTLDLAQLAFAESPTPANRARLIEAGESQLATTRVMVDTARVAR